MLRCDGTSSGGGGVGIGSSNNAHQGYRGPIWTEDRFSSGKPVTARVLVSARGDYLVEMEARNVNKNNNVSKGGRTEVVGHGDGHDPLSQPPTPSSDGKGESKKNTTDGNDAGLGGVLRLEVRAQDLRAIFRGLDKRRHEEEEEKKRERRMERLLTPNLRMELCR